MTTLFRQGVESVCKGKRDRQGASPPRRRKPPLQREARLGTGRQAKHRTGGRGYREKQAQSSAGSSKRGATFMHSSPSCPQRMTTLFRPVLQVWFLRGRSKLKSISHAVLCSSLWSSLQGSQGPFWGAEMGPRAYLLHTLIESPSLLLA